MASITEKFLEHPEIRAYFYEDSRLDEEHPSFAVVNAKIKVMCRCFSITPRWCWLVLT